ncbi:hypothetical protein J6590_003896 [Homalodisca vitripennis]|nr:hypothetical protein J6590_003896 [Homalodisca vitripennis]
MAQIEVLSDSQQYKNRINGSSQCGHRNNYSRAKILEFIDYRILENESKRCEPEIIDDRRDTGRVTSRIQFSKSLCILNEGTIEIDGSLDTQNKPQLNYRKSLDKMTKRVVHLVPVHLLLSVTGICHRLDSWNLESCLCIDSRRCTKRKVNWHIRIESTLPTKATLCVNDFPPARLNERCVQSLTLIVLVQTELDFNERGDAVLGGQCRGLKLVIGRISVNQLVRKKDLASTSQRPSWRASFPFLGLSSRRLPILSCLQSINERGNKADTNLTSQAHNDLYRVLLFHLSPLVDTSIILLKLIYFLHLVP